MVLGRRTEPRDPGKRGDTEGLGLGCVQRDEVISSKAFPELGLVEAIDPAWFEGGREESLDLGAADVVGLDGSASFRDVVAIDLRVDALEARLQLN